MFIPALFRRILIYLAFLMLTAFGLLLVHRLMSRELPPLIAAVGAIAAVGVIALCGRSMIKTDDYLTPRHTRYFFILTTLFSLLLAGGITFYLATSDEYPSSFLRLYGLGSIGAAVGYSCFAWMRIREAYMLPPEYRPDPNLARYTLLPLFFSIPALFIAAAAFLFSISDLDIPDFAIVEPRRAAASKDEEEEIKPAAEETPIDRNQRAEEVFEAGKKALEEERYRTAHRAFQRAADLRHPEAYYELALLYMDEGFLHDTEKAHDYLQRAVTAGHPDAVFLLAEARRFGNHGFEKDQAEARRLFEIAAVKDHVKAQSQLAHMLANGEGGPVDHTNAFYWFKRAVDLGDKVAQNDIGIFYLQGKGVEADPQKGIEWLTRAAEQGVAVAEYNLGQAYYSGEFVEQNYEQAKIYFEKLAERKIPYGFQMIGVQYLHGQGAPKDEKEAFEAFIQGAGRGDTASQYYLGYCYLEGLGTEKDSSAAIHYLTAAANKNHAEAQLVLGNIYRDGKVILADHVEAAKWYRLSMENGSEEAASLMEKLSETLSADQLDDAENRIRFFKRENQG